MNNDDKEDIYKVEDDEDIYKVEDDEDEYVSASEPKEDLKNKLIKYSIIIFIGLIIFVLLMAILFPGKKKKQEIVAKNITLTTGDKYQINYSKGTYSWTSSNQSVAKVSDNGEIIAIKNGDTTITIKSGNENITYKVHVDKVDDSIVVTNIKMATNTIELEKDKTYDMKVSFTPKGVENVGLTWDSSDTNVATVKDGLIKAIGPGTCIITVKTPNGNIDYCLVKVLGKGEYNPVQNINIKSTDVSLNKGTSYNLSYEVTPSDSVNLVTWESSNPKIATVENGVVYALSGGNITVTAKSGDIKKTINVTVIEKKNEVVLDYNNMGLYVGDTYTLTYNNISGVTWTSSNTDVAKVDQNGKVIAVAVGKALITVRTENSSDECLVEVFAKEEVVKDKISLNVSSIAMNVGDKAKLKETVTPSNNVSGVTWTSSNTNVATVSKGEVTAKANGTATITAKLPNGEKAECVVNVSTRVINPLLVQINLSGVTIPVNGTTQLSAKILPSDATNKTITWYTSNPMVATVDNNGKVTAKAKGSAKIYAKAVNGVFDSCAVYVK